MNEYFDQNDNHKKDFLVTEIVNLCLDLKINRKTSLPEILRFFNIRNMDHLMSLSCDELKQFRSKLLSRQKPV